MKAANLGLTITFLSTLALGAGCNDRRLPGRGEGPSDRPREDERKLEQPGVTTLSSAPAPLANAPLLPGVPDIPTLVATVTPAVVNITVTQEVKKPMGMTDPFEFFFGQRPGSPGAPQGPGTGGGRDTNKRQALGSGFILDGAGHVATNAHVVDQASAVRVTLADEREYEAKVLGRDERLDLAVLEIQGAKDLPHVTLGASDKLRVGEYVVAIGNPFGLGDTVTMGIVSAKSRAIGAGPYDDFIQTDASINPGNSGGPLFNLRGEVIGINTAINPAGQGIGFAIPIDAFKDVFPELVSKGAVSRGHLGVAIQRVDAPLAKALGMDRPRGALIGETEPGGPAAKAGIKPGEVIEAVDDAKVGQAHELPRLIARHPPGERVKLTVRGANGATRTTEVTLDALKEERSAKHTPESRTPRESAPADQRELGIELVEDPREGVVVRAVDPSGPAADALRPGDAVVEVNGAPVKTARDVTQGIRSAPSDRPTLMKVRRAGHTLFVALERKK